MSRIHEALKKAEQEREGLPHAEAPVSVVTDMEEAPRASAGRVPPRNQSVAVDQAPRFAERTWTPDVKISRLLSSSSSMMGTEELRTLRARLRQIRERHQSGMKKLLITSAQPGEGKTFITSSLGLMFGRQPGLRVLLVDADLRRPRLQKALGAHDGPGLTDFLSGNATEQEVVQHGTGTNLFLVPAGKTVANPSELLANGKFDVLMDWLAPHFDWILVDSPPAVPLHDASLLADRCDGVLMVVRADTTPFDIAQKAKAELQDKNIVGVVLNQVDESQRQYGYYYRYYGDGPGTAKTDR